MNLIDAAQANSFCQLLQVTQSSDNEERRRGEEELMNTAINQSDLLALALIHTIRFIEDPVLRSYSSLLFRRMFALPNSALPQPDNVDPVLFNRLTGNTKEACKHHLIEALRSEIHPACRNQLCDTVTDLFIYFETSQQSWAELPLLTIDLCNEFQPEPRKSGFKLVAAYPNLIPDAKLNAIGKAFNLATVKDHPSVRLAVIKAYVAMLINAEKQRHDHLVPYLPHMFKILETLYSDRDEDALGNGISCFIELAEEKSGLLVRYLGNIVKFCGVVMSDRELDESPRHIALEFLLTIIEGSPSKVKLHQNSVLEPMVPLLMGWMANLEDHREWYHIDSLKSYEEDEEFDVAQSGLDRLATSLGGKVMYPTVLNHAITMAQSLEWNHRHASVLSISAIGEGSYKYMRLDIENVLKLMLPLMSDAHPRVRYATAHAFGQMATDFPDEFTIAYHSVIIPSLVRLLEDGSVPRVQAHAVAALLNIAECLNKDILAPYLGPLLEKLVALLMGGSPYLQEEVVTTIASIADSAEDGFSPYYTSVVPILVDVVLKAIGPEYRMLRAKAIESISLIGLAVGYDTIVNDIPNFIGLFTNLQNEVGDKDDVLVSYLQQAWTRLAMVLGKEFQPHLLLVMPQLIQSAKIKPEVVILDSNDDFEEKYPEEQGWDFTESHGHMVGIRTFLLEEKAGAIEMLLCYAQSLQSGFVNYAPDLIPIMTSLFNYIYHHDTRSAAVRCIPHLLYCLIDADIDINILSQHSHFILQNITRQLRIEGESDMFNLIMNSLIEVIDMAHFAITPEVVMGLVKEMLPRLNHTVKSLTQHHNLASQPGFDEDSMDPDQHDAIEWDHEFLKNLNYFVHILLKLTNHQHFERLEPILQVCNSSFTSQAPPLRKFACAVFDDVVEFGGDYATQYFKGVFVEPIIRLLLDSDSDVRHSASYGIGVWAQYGGEPYHPAINQAMPNLISLITSSDPNQSDQLITLHAAIQALATVILYKSQSLDLSPYYFPFLNALPIKEDLDAADSTHTKLVEWLEGENITDLNMMGRVKQILMEIVQYKLGGDYTINRIEKYLAKFQ